MSDHGRIGSGPDAQWASEGPSKTAQQDAHAPVGTGQPKAQQESQQPMDVVLWGLVSEEVEERLKQGVPKLRPQDWRSGDRLWVVEVIAPFGGENEMLQNIKTQIFPNHQLFFVRSDPGNKRVEYI